MIFINAFYKHELSNIHFFYVYIYIMYSILNQTLKSQFVIDWNYFDLNNDRIYNTKYLNNFKYTFNQDK